MASERSFEDRKQKALELKGVITSFTPAYVAEDAAFTEVALTAAIDAATAPNTAVDDGRGRGRVRIPPSPRLQHGGWNGFSYHSQETTSSGASVERSLWRRPG